MTSTKGDPVTDSEREATFAEVKVGDWLFIRQLTGAAWWRVKRADIRPKLAEIEFFDADAAPGTHTLLVRPVTDSVAIRDATDIPPLSQLGSGARSIG